MFSDGLSVTLAWDPNPEPDVAGYVVRYGPSSGGYTHSINVGNVARVTLFGLDRSQIYYIVVAAYNLIGLEGAPSNEVIFIPSPPPPPDPPNPPPVIIDHSITVLANERDSIPMRFQPDDREGTGAGLTPLDRVYAKGALLTVKAPEDFEGKKFSKWFLDGFEVSQNATLTFLVQADHTLEAIYIEKALVGHWKVEERQGTTIADSSGNGHHGELNNGAGWANGVLRGGALHFGGEQSFVEIPDDEQLEFRAQDFTLALWVRTSRLTPQALVEKRHTSTVGMFLFALTRHPAVKGAFSIYTGSAWLDSAFRGTLDGAWHHLAVTQDSLGFKLYHNGVLDSSFPVKGVYQATAFPLILGVSPVVPGNWPFEGDMDDIRLYHRVLGAEEISEVILEQTRSSLQIRAVNDPSAGLVRLVLYLPDGQAIQPHLLERVDILASEDPTLPVSEWTVLPAPVWAGDVGTVSDGVNSSRSQRFYLLVERP